VEVISLADKLLGSFEIEGYKIKINSLGCANDKNKLIGILRSKLKGKEEKLCPDCKNRLINNPLRILDCKNEPCKEIAKALNISDEYLCADCKSHFKKVREGLDALEIIYEVSPHLVRGLDYYTGTVFEISHGELGSQDAIGAGGRYNNLVEELGGSEAGAIGFAFGLERLLLAAQNKEETFKKEIVYLIALGDNAKSYGVKLLAELRDNNIAADTDYENKSIKGAMRRANDLGARTVLIIGDNEIAKGIITLKDMVSGEQKEVRSEDIIKEIKC
jgi:histidyl-tRNA synthetase